MQVNFSKNIDSETYLMGYAAWGTGQVDPEQDAAFHTMHYYFLASKYGQELDYMREPLKEGFSKALAHFTHSDGVFRRFPTAGMNSHLPSFGISEHAHYDRPENLSRDNTLPIILACGEFGEHKAIADFAIKMLKRGSFFQNTYDTQGKKKPLPDFADPSHWSVIARAYVRACDVADKDINMFLMPIIAATIVLGDLAMILSNLLTVLNSWYEPNHAPSELGHVCRTLQAKELPTLFSKIARLLYVKGRRRASSVFPDKIWQIGKWEYFKLWCKVTFSKRESLHKTELGVFVSDDYWDKSAVMSGLNYFFRSSTDAPFPEYCKQAVKEIE